MKNFNSNNKFGGKKRFDNDRGFRRDDRSERPAMHKAICADCGRECEVPFRPTGDKPVFCSSCFGKKEGSGPSRFEKRDFGRPNFGDKKMFKAICDKCHKECEVPFRPTGDKAVYCSECFGKGDKAESGSFNSSNPSSSQYQKQFDIVISKLDVIMKMLAQKKNVNTESTIEEKPIILKTEKIAVKKVEVKKIEAKKKTTAPRKAGKKVIAKKRKS
jgi:CxxC-x17-CxxC domain-containing protein